MPRMVNTLMELFIYMLWFPEDENYKLTAEIVHKGDLISSKTWFGPDLANLLMMAGAHWAAVSEAFAGRHITKKPKTRRRKNSQLELPF